MKPAPKKWWGRWYVAAFLLFALLGSAVALYQLRLKEPSQVQIDTAVKGQNWGLAVSLIRRVDLTTDQGLNYYNLGLAHMNLGHDQDALDAFMQADDRNFKRSEARFYIATIYAKLQERDLALHWLRDAFDSGFEDYDRVRSNEHLVALRLDGVRQDSDLSDGANSIDGLDFMIGTWGASAPPGGNPPTVTFTKMISGLAIAESWSGAAPGGSSGIYLYDPEAQRWNYTSVDVYGRVFRGTVRINRQISITGTLTTMDGVETVRKVEIQVSSGVIDYAVAESRDGGRTWDPEDRRRLSLPVDSPRPQF